MNAKLLVVLVAAAGLGALSALLPQMFIPGSKTEEVIMLSPMESIGGARSPHGSFGAHLSQGTKRVDDKADSRIVVYSVDDYSSGRQLCWERDLSISVGERSAAPRHAAVQWVDNQTVRYGDPFESGIILQVRLASP